MKIPRRYIVALSVPLLLTAFAPEAFPLTNSKNSVTVIPAEGNVQCSDYASNAVIRAMGTSNVQASGTVNGPDSPLDLDVTGETATYLGTLTAGKVTKITNFTASTPINYAIVKKSGEVTIYIYPTGGVLTDENLTLGSGAQIAALNLCYGIPAAALPPPPPPVTIPSCDETGGIDQTSVGCPTDGSQTFVCNFELKDAFGDPTKNFGLDNEDCCTCNVPAAEAFTECDPNIEITDPENPPPGACPQGVLVEPTSLIEGVRNPDTCFYKTILGERRLVCSK